MGLIIRMLVPLLVLLLGSVGCESEKTDDEVVNNSARPKPTQGTEENPGYFLSCNREKTVAADGRFQASIGCGLYDNNSKQKSPAGDEAAWELDSPSSGDVEVTLEDKAKDSVYHVVFRVLGESKEGVDAFLKESDVEASVGGEPPQTIEAKELSQAPFKVFSMNYRNYTACPADSWPVPFRLLSDKKFFLSKIYPLLQESFGMVWSWQGREKNMEVESAPLIANATMFDVSGLKETDSWEYRPEGIHDQIKNRLIPLSNDDYMGRVGYQVCALDKEALPKNKVQLFSR